MQLYSRRSSSTKFCYKVGMNCWKDKKIIFSLLLLMILFVQISCVRWVDLPIQVRGWMRGKTESIPVGTGDLVGYLYISSGYRKNTAVVYIPAYDKKYFPVDNVHADGYFLVEHIPCGKWPIIVEMERKKESKHKHYRFQGNTCITHLEYFDFVSP